ncbi:MULTISPECIES: cyanophycinase [unclassified Clostridium]|uniref:cyanophycinase n=1 Tax=unclassified Clostridium TaxID=2614128 RepID=UPI00052C738D|nr:MULTISPECIES: cyanophycinase [unclassified Clostridium]KGK90676.1 cyanophycinase [Clostridium sp. HMP27]
MEERIKSNLIIIGGAEDKEGDKNILKEVCSHIDKDKDELLIATVASGVPEELGDQYKYIFSGLGVKNIAILNVKERKDAYDDYHVNLISRASIVFFTGGDQLRITSLIGGTPLYRMMKKRYEEGCMFVGTSAGASVMSDTMIVTGPEEESPRKCTLKMAPGLGLIKGVIIDQHFAQRGRIGRLLVGISENPESIGIGIDEDTAIIVNREAQFSVIGSGAVYVIDGSEITKTNVSEQNPDEILSICNIKMHILKKDDKYDLNRRTP